jgi:hypothetical protein
VHVGVQRGTRHDDVLDPVPADVATASWQFEATTKPTATSVDLRSPYIQGRPGDRFIYLSWGTFEGATFVMFGRSKLLLSAVDEEIRAAAVASGWLVGRVALVDERGRLRQAAVKPPAIVWSAS